MLETAKTPDDKVRQLQRKLYVCAKQSRTRRFHALYDRIYRSDVLWEAWRRVRSNGGAAGVDAETIQAIEQRGPGEFLSEIQAALRAGQYRPSPVKRRYIPKADGEQRPLGIPTIRDRVVQAAAKIVIEPIFEADFQPSSYGFRPKRSATQALEAIRVAGNRGHNFVVDADIQGYLDTASYCPLIHESSPNSSGCCSTTLIRKPLRRPCVTRIACNSPRLTRCNTVCRETPSFNVVSSIGRYSGGACCTMCARSSSLIRICHGTLGVTCS